MSPIMTTELDGASLRRAFACFPSGVTAICAMVDGEPMGMAASSFTSVSLDPPLVSVCIARESTTWAQLRRALRLGVTVLGAHHESACRQLASRGANRFAGLDWHPSVDGAVYLGGATLTLDCALEEEVPAGDHFIALLRIHAVNADIEVAPLIFHGSTYRQLLPSG